MKKRKRIKNAAYFCLILVLVFVMLFSRLQILESTALRNAQEEEKGSSAKTIIRDGVEYFPRQDITTFLIMGIDQFGKVEQSESYNNRGAADMLMLLVFDEEQETCTAIHLNRDTMVTMPVIGLGGKQAGTAYGQLALSHTYGNGLHESGDNTRKTVSNLLYGIQIDYYLAMNMDAVAILNDAVGGVTVTVEDDFSQVDPSITMGEMTLMGDQAIHYVRTRKDVGDQKNTSRVERQKEYIDGFVAAFKEKQEKDSSFIADAYDEVSDYIVSDCTVNGIMGMLDRYEGYEITEVISPEGDNVLGETYYEFYPDEEKLDELILRIFYRPKG